jgi:energy-coupling factor transporter ATP-binding protein EcfA2
MSIEGRKMTTFNSDTLSREFWLHIARTLLYGHNSGMMYVLCGPQGCGKSRLVAALAGDWKSAVISAQNLHSHDFTGVAFVEVTDGDNLTSKQSARFKKLLTDNPGTVFIGMTNTPPPVDNENPKLRFIQIGQINIAKFERDREQLLAEAVAAVKAEGRIEQ